MIEINIKIEEVAPGRCDISAKGISTEFTKMEADAGDAISEAITSVSHPDYEAETHRHIHVRTGK